MVTVVVVLVLLGASVGAFGLTHRVVAKEETRALNDRAANVVVSLLTAEQNAVASLQVLGNIAASRQPGALRIFDEVAAHKLLTKPLNVTELLALINGTLAVR